MVALPLEPQPGKICGRKSTLARGQELRWCRASKDGWRRSVFYEISGAYLNGWRGEGDACLPLTFVFDSSRFLMAQKTRYRQNYGNVDTLWIYV